MPIPQSSRELFFVYARLSVGAGLCGALRESMDSVSKAFSQLLQSPDEQSPFRVRELNIEEVRYNDAATGSSKSDSLSTSVSTVLSGRRG